MLRIRASVHAGRAAELAETLGGTGGVHRIVRSEAAAAPEQVVLSADLDPSAADQVVDVLHDLGITTDDYVLVREEVIVPSALGRHRLHAARAFAWVELIGQARANSRPIGRYLALMAVAGVIAAVGVITDNPILIVGAMAVSPDLLPICATSVGLVGERPQLARRAALTLAVGLALVILVATVLSVLLDVTGILSGSFTLETSRIGKLASTDWSTVLVAFAAGIAAILAFETRASAAVGVAISVTTIPASAYAGVAIGTGEASSAGGALIVLAVNVALLTASGTITLLIQHALARRAERT